MKDKNLKDNTETTEVDITETEVQEVKVKKEVTEKKVEKEEDMTTMVEKEDKDPTTDQRITTKDKKLMILILIHHQKNKSLENSREKKLKNLSNKDSPLSENQNLKPKKDKNNGMNILMEEKITMVIKKETIDCKNKIKKPQFLLFSYTISSKV